MLAKAIDGTTISASERAFVWTSPSPRGRNDLVRRARLSVEQFPHGLLIFGEAATVLAANRQAESIFGYGPGELVGLPMSILVPEQSRAAHAELWGEFLSTPQTGRMGPDRIVGGVRKDGIIVPIEIGLSVFVEGDSRCMVGSIVDITERLNLEARLAAAMNERLGFQRFVADIAARFVSVEPDALDDAIVTSLGEIGEALQLDLAVLWRKSRDDATLVPTHSWVRPPSRSGPDSFPIASIPFVI